MSSLVALLDEQGDELLRRWTVRLAPVAPPAWSAPEIQDTGRELLRALVAVLRSGRPAEVRPPGPESRRLGVSPGHDLGARVHAYGLFREGVFELVEETGSALSVPESRLLGTFFADVVADEVGAHEAAVRRTPDETEQERSGPRAEALAEVVRARDAELRLVVDALPVLVSFVTADERYGLCNRAYEDWFGVTHESLVGRKVREVIGEAAYAVLGPYVRRGLAGEAFSFEQHRVPYRHGGTRDVRVTFVPRKEADGRVSGYVALLEDITAWRRLEEEREVALGRERQAREEAEQANALKDQFMATVSHELRTPLTAMLGWTRMLRGGSLPEGRRGHALETVERNALAQVRLIDDLLDMSRIVEGKLQLDVTPVDFAAVVEAALDAIRPAALAKAIRLDPALDPGADPLRGDAARLQQVVSNLLTNAVKFTPRGGRVQVRLERAGSFVELLVTDSGQGIEAAFLPHVFERFRQADGSSTRTHAGLGLGLAIVRHLVELHGGTVRVASEGPGLGATFAVRLPLPTSHAPEGDRRPSQPAPGAQEIDCPPGIAGLRVLVVDDERDTRDLLAALFEGCGALVTSAASVGEALATFAARQPDVVVSDLGMPGEDGYALIGALRGRPSEAGGGTPAIALSAFAHPEDRSRALRAGYNLHVAKPVDPTELLAVVARLAQPGPPPA